MKRKISLLLAVVMILGSFSFVFADDDFNVAAFLEKEGILVGNDSGDLMLDEALLRRDAVVLLARLLDKEAEAKAFEKEGLPTFTDLTDNPYYKGFLAWAEDNGYFIGKTDGSFGYTDNLEAVEYATVLLRALGYTNEAEWEKAWAEAEKLGLLEDIKAERRDEVKREEVAQMTYNALGVTMKDSDKTLAEFLGITLPEAKELKATVNDTENLKEIKVELTNAKLANEDKLLNTSNYRLSGNVIERVELKDNDVLVQVKDALRDGKQYELQIKGVDKAIDGKYKFVAKDNTIPSVEKVEVLGEYGIKVVTSEPIKDVRGKNFLVDGKYIVMNVETYGRNLVLTPYNGSFPSNADTLTIEGLVDYAGYKSAKEDFEIEIVKDNEAPKVVDAILKGNKVEVVFDKDIYDDSIEAYEGRSSVGNISYESGRHTIYAKDAKKIDTNKVSYEFKDNESPSRRDDVTIVDVTNHSKVKMGKTTIALREVLDDIEPEIVEKKLVDKDVDEGTATIELHFDKEVSGSLKTDDNDEYRFEAEDHFTLYEDEVSKRNESKAKVLSAEYRYDKRNDEYEKDVIVVKLGELKEWKKGTPTDFEYILEIEDFRDISSSRNKMYRDYYEFEFKRGTDFVVEDVKVTLKGSRDTEIEIKFSKKLDLEKAEDGTNYIFYKNDGSKRVSKKDIKDLDGKARLQSNGKIVELDIPKGWDDIEYDYDGLKILESIKDTSGSRLDRVYYYEFASGELLKEGQTAEDKANEEKAKAVVDLINELPKAEEITLANKEAVEKARAEYDKLTPEQLEFVDDEVLAKLVAAEAKIEELEKEASDKDEAEKVKAINDATTLTELWDALVAAEIKNLEITLLADYDAELTGDEETLEAIQNAIDKVNLDVEKEAAKKALDEYKDAADYTVNGTDLANAIVDGKAAIDAVTTIEEVATALAGAKAAIDDIESDADLVEKAKENLDLGDLSAVTTDLTLPSTQDEATVTWESDDTDVITNGGVVTRPVSGEANAEVTLTATIKVGAAEDTKVFTVTVLAED